jgi:hypothetical protein
MSRNDRRVENGAGGPRMHGHLIAILGIVVGAGALADASAGTKKQPGSSSARDSYTGRPMKEIRKQVFELTPKDLRDCAVWEFALDEEGVEGQDEATVRPVSTTGALDPAAGMFIVRASFLLADGTRMSGYLTPGVAGDRGLGTVQPVIVGETGQVGFWMGTIRPQRSDLEKWYRELGKSAGQLFPLEFRSEVTLVGGPVVGSVPGFLVLKDIHGKQVDVLK